jgi:hypothetical protein
MFSQLNAKQNWASFFSSAEFQAELINKQYDMFEDKEGYENEVYFGIYDCCDSYDAGVHTEIERLKMESATTILQEEQEEFPECLYSPPSAFDKGFM